MGLAPGTHLLKAARTPAADALEGPDHAQHLAPRGVIQAHGEAAQGSTAVPRATVIHLLCVEELLPHAVMHFILVVALKANESCGAKERAQLLWPRGLDAMLAASPAPTINGGHLAHLDT